MPNKRRGPGRPLAIDWPSVKQYALALASGLSLREAESRSQVQRRQIQRWREADRCVDRLLDSARELGLSPVDRDDDFVWAMAQVLLTSADGNDAQYRKAVDGVWRMARKESA
ncbi:MAG: hypothetical protein DCC71_12145 [Proteobacteria bacterium]|nr:MAG: hypothetical protein DCC71_12145 [Pseudomonadota bacterium]